MLISLINAPLFHTAKMPCQLLKSERKSQILYSLCRPFKEMIGTAPSQENGFLTFGLQKLSPECFIVLGFTMGLI